MPSVADLTNALMVAISALAGVVGYLWRRQIVAEDETKKKLADCEKSHGAVQVQFADLKQETGYLRGKLELLAKEK